MKKLLFVLCLFVSLTFANHVSWQGNYDKALEEARDNDKILMVLLIKNDSIPCKKLVKDIFTNQPYIVKLNQNIVSVIVNKDNSYSYPIEMYWSNEYPTLFFVNSDNETFLHEPLYGGVTTEEIKKVLNKLYKLQI